MTSRKKTSENTWYYGKKRQIELYPKTVEIPNQHE